jgi:WD40-like Beta Propeller Repeat
VAATPLLARLAASLAALAIMAAPAHATFPGRNGSLVFTAHFDHGPGTHAVYLDRLSPRSGEEHRRFICSDVNPAAHCAFASAATVAPDGRQVAILFASGFAVPMDAVLRLTTISGDEDRVVDIADPFAFSWSTDKRGVRWLPDGGALSVEIQGTLASLGLDGMLDGPLVPGRAVSVDWAIDGRAAFIRGGDLYVTRRGGSARRVARHAAEPSWSPHGRWVAFTRAGKLFVVPSGSGKARQLRVGTAAQPVWSPDGRLIAFVRRSSKIPGATSFYLYDREKRRTRRLTRELAGESLVFSPAEWQPLPR